MITHCLLQKVVGSPILPPGNGPRTQWCIMRRLQQILIATLFLTTPLMAQGDLGQNLLMNQGRPGKVMVTNRILAKVNGKALSAVDVVHKLDAIFYRQFAEHADNDEMRYQFYLANWKYILGELINKELIVADAAKAKFEVKSGDVRQELEETFGPQLMANLNKAGLTYEQAWDMTQEDILLRRMMMARVNSKAMLRIGPRQVWDEYKKLAKEKELEGEWLYQVITVRGDDEGHAAAIAKMAQELLNSGVCDLEDVKTYLDREALLSGGTKISVSAEFRRDNKDISQAHMDLLKGLEAGEFGLPLEQLSRVGNSKVQRFAFLKEKKEGEAPLYVDVEAQIKGKLMQQAMMAETQTYFEGLRKQYAVEELVEMASGSDKPPFYFAPTTG